MTPSFARVRPIALHCALLIFSAVWLLSEQASAEDVISLQLDQARLAKLPANAGTLVIGNPLIADVTLEQGGTMVLTGKGYGVTNLIALDRSGAVISEQLIQVQAATDTVVVVYRGVDRESYSCTPKCERRITLGDSPQFFTETINETSVRASRAAAGRTGR
jgi:Flp pilus assembly secretin CpaC